MSISTKKPKCLIFIDHNITVRHFILSGAFKKLEQEYAVTYVFNEDKTTDKEWLTVDPKSLKLNRILTTNIPRSRMGSWYQLFAISLLNSQRGTSNYKYRKDYMKTINGTLRTYWYEFQSLPLIFPFIRKLKLKKQGIWAPLRDLIKAENPDIVVHPSILTGYYINDLIPICESMNIPSVVLMNSWDNPSQKAITTSAPTLLGVWGNQTRNHAIEHMGLQENRVKIMGAAQFDLYRQPITESDSELRAMFRVPKDKPIILYGGVSKSVNETEHLKLLDNAISTGQIPDCHILYRPHPWRGSLTPGEQNFFDVGFKNVSMDPHMQRYYRAVLEKPDNSFDLADYDVVRKLLHLIQGTISSMSTIQLETALFGKPSISFLNQRDIENHYGRLLKISMRLAHFNALWDCPGIQFCRSDDDLSAAVNEMLKISNDKKSRAIIKQYAEQEYVNLGEFSYSVTLNQAVNEVLLKTRK